MVPSIVNKKDNIKPHHIFKVDLKENITVYLEVMVMVVILWIDGIIAGSRLFGNRMVCLITTAPGPSAGVKRTCFLEVWPPLAFDSNPLGLLVWCVA